jgi:REP element-mobilizing transposase RayT
MPQSIHVLYTHIVFSTKERRPMLRAEVQPKLFAYMSTILLNLGCTDVLINGVTDHVHVFCNLTKKHPTAKVMEILKRDSSKWLKREFLDLKTFHWQDGYGLFSVSPTHTEAVKQYIRDQEAHHQTHSFQDELRRILKKHDVAVDERYLWG